MPALPFDRAQQLARIEDARKSVAFCRANRNREHMDTYSAHVLDAIHELADVVEALVLARPE
jgi:hypothetical protein